MKQKLSKKFAYWLGVIVVGIALGFAIQFVRAWTEPGSTPPAGNVGAPLNTSDKEQTKEGGLLLGSSTPGGNKGDGSLNANQVCIRGVCQTTWPSGGNSYPSNGWCSLSVGWESSKAGCYYLWKCWDGGGCGQLSRFCAQHWGGQNFNQGSWRCN